MSEKIEMVVVNMFGRFGFFLQYCEIFIAVLKTVEYKYFFITPKMTTGIILPGFGAEKFKEKHIKVKWL